MHEARVDVAVLGAGTTGCAAAYFLARAGLRVCLVELTVAGGGGASAVTGGLVRAYDPDPALARIGPRSVQLFRQWESRGLPGASPMVRSGFYYFVPEAAADQAAVQFAQLLDQGYPVEMHTVAECARRLGFLRRDHPAAFVLFEPLGGTGNARLTCQQMAQAVAAARGMVLEQVGAAPCIEDGPQGWTVVLHHGRVSAQAVLLAAGAGVRHFLSGVPLSVRRIPVARLEGTSVVPLVDECSQTYFVPTGSEGFLCGFRPNTVVSGDIAPAMSAADLETALQHAAQVLDSSFQPLAVGGMAGLDTYCDDLRPLLGFHDAKRRLYIAGGFSGRGYKYCLSIGEAIANAICGSLGRDAPFPDACSLDAFAPTRLAPSSAEPRPASPPEVRR